MGTKRILAALTAALLVGAGCATPLSDEPGAPEHEINLSELENDLGGADPIENVNRVMFAVNDFCMDYIVDFIARIYCTILPRPVIDAIDNVCVNLEYPARVVSCLLSAEWRGAGDETVRFLANSTIGLGGLFDVAEPWWDFHSTDSDFGQAFAAWGIDPGCTFMPPFVKAVNVRDTVGRIFDTAFDGKTYIPFSGYVTTVNRMVVAQRDFIALVEGSSDRYKTFREAFLAYRELQLRKFAYRAKIAADAARTEAPAEPLPPSPRPAGVRGDWLAIPLFPGETPQEQSMRLSHFRPQRDDDFWFYPLSFFNRDFVRAGSRRKLAFHPGRPGLRYTFWRRPDPSEDAPAPPEKLALVLPGIGGAWNSPACLAAAELFHRAGYHVATFDSSFHWNFVLGSNPHVRLPGFLPEDAAAVRDMLVAALEDMKERGDIDDPYTVLAGYSMGGMQALKIAASERGQSRLKLDRIVAVNPPVDLRRALTCADSFIRRGGAWSRREAVDKLLDVSGREYMAHARILPPLGGPGAPPPASYRIGADPDAVACAVGLYLKSSLRDVLMVAHRERPLDGIETPYATLRRNRLYLELDAVSFRRYAEEMLAKEYPGVAMEELFALSSLRSIEHALRDDARIRVVHSWNDPLIDEADARFLDRTLGKRLLWTSGGGHLGNLCAAEVQTRLIGLAEPEDQAPGPAANGAPPAGTAAL